MEHRGSRDDDSRKVRIRLKTDAPPNPKVYKPKKSAIKKDGDEQDAEGEDPTDRTSFEDSSKGSISGRDSKEEPDSTLVKDKNGKKVRLNNDTTTHSIDYGGREAKSGGQDIASHEGKSLDSEGKTSKSEPTPVSKFEDVSDIPYGKGRSVSAVITVPPPKELEGQAKGSSHDGASSEPTSTKFEMEANNRQDKPWEVSKSESTAPQTESKGKDNVTNKGKSGSTETTKMPSPEPKELEHQSEDHSRNSPTQPMQPPSSETKIKDGETRTVNSGSHNEAPLIETVDENGSLAQNVGYNQQVQLGTASSKTLTQNRDLSANIGASKAAAAGATLEENNTPMMSNKEKSQELSVNSRVSKTMDGALLKEEINRPLQEYNNLNEGRIPDLQKDNGKDKVIRKSSSSSITGRIRQSIEKLLTKDDSTKRVSSSSKDKESLNDKQQLSISGSMDSKTNSERHNAMPIEEKDPKAEDIVVAKVSIHNIDEDRDASTKVSIKIRKKTDDDQPLNAVHEVPEPTGRRFNENEQRKDSNHDHVQEGNIISDITITTSDSSYITNSKNSEVIKIGDESMANSEKSKTTTMQEGLTELADDTPKMEEKADVGNENIQQQGNESQQPMNNEIAENTKGQEKPIEIPEEGTNDAGKDQPDEQKHGNNGSQDEKIKDVKKRVRPGNVFIVKGDEDSFSVKWAQKRKVFAYKVGSKNTSRFSTLLLETVEQLERTSVRHPSILSEFAQTSKNSPKTSLLSTYLAGANARQSFRDHFTKDIGTNTSHHQKQSDGVRKSPDTNLWVKDHLSPGNETFGGAEAKEEAKVQMKNYNYPFLTDYDANHERKENK